MPFSLWKPSIQREHHCTRRMLVLISVVCGGIQTQVNWKETDITHMDCGLLTLTLTVMPSIREPVFSRDKINPLINRAVITIMMLMKSFTITMAPSHVTIALQIILLHRMSLPVSRFL